MCHDLQHIQQEHVTKKSTCIFKRVMISRIREAHLNSQMARLASYQFDFDLS